MKSTTKITAGLIAFLILTSCSTVKTEDTTSAESTVVEETTEVTGETTEETTATEETTTVKESHYTYDPYCTSEMLDQVYGEKRHDAYISLVDAAMNGRHEFECEDQDTFDWMIYQYPYQSCPVLSQYYDGFSDPTLVVGGKLGLKFTISDEEFAEKNEEFKDLVEGILNEVFEDDYTDFEKALALYLYFCTPGNFVYDYDMVNNPEALDYLSIYRVLTERKGICQDLSLTYSYLLRQAGVEAGVVSGQRGYDDELHQWSLVRINGKYYHVDPTYALNTSGDLQYFLMDDDAREACDDYGRDQWTYVGYYSILSEFDVSVFKSDDKRFSELWKGSYATFSPDTKTIQCSALNEDTGFYEITELDYSELEK